MGGKIVLEKCWTKGRCAFERTGGTKAVPVSNLGGEGSCWAEMPVAFFPMLMVHLSQVCCRGTDMKGGREREGKKEGADKGYSTFSLPSTSMFFPLGKIFNQSG